MALRKAIRPIADSKGFFTGTITSFELKDFTQEIVDEETGEIASRDYTSYVLELDINSNGPKPIQLNERMGEVLNPVPVKEYGVNRGGKDHKRVYNKFTTTCVALDLLKVESIDDMSEKDYEKFDDSITGLVGRQVKLKLSRNKKNYFEMDISTLRLIDDSPKKAVKTS